MNTQKFKSFGALITFLLIAVIITSCGSSKKVNNDFLYFKQGSDTTTTPVKRTLIQPFDLLSIQVISRTMNQEQAAIFNFPATKDAEQVPGYQVSAAGEVEIPVIGPVKADGLTIEALQASIAEKLNNYVKNPGVLVRFLQFDINVLGEVHNPGIQKFKTDRVTVIDAISSAGDLTDYGKRDDVVVIREQYGKKITYKLDLRNRRLFESPVYYLQPNDIVYVSPTKNKLKNLDVDPEAQRKTGLFFSIASIILSIGSIIVFAVN
ncbi:polysaccharide biosynthesis/export family protein [Flavitalea sp.]|nr:polysaccharide biosynthesis/export family protein [Flavitalea sp.]